MLIFQLWPNVICISLNEQWTEVPNLHWETIMKQKPPLFSVTALISGQLHPFIKKIPSSKTQKVKLIKDQPLYTEDIHMWSLWSSCQFYYGGKASRCNLPVCWTRLWSVLVMREPKMKWAENWSWETAWWALAHTWKEKWNPQNQEKMRGYHVTEQVLNPITSTSTAFLPSWTLTLQYADRQSSSEKALYS